MEKDKSNIIFHFLWALPTFGLSMLFLSLELDILNSLGFSIVIYGMDIKNSILEDRVAKLEKQSSDKKTTE
jgi:hypothetical protein